jgi:histone H3/H4
MKNTHLQMADLIVKSNVKEALEGYNVSADIYDALDDEVEELLADAARRAEANDRKTVRPQDL